MEAARRPRAARAWPARAAARDRAASAGAHGKNSGMLPTSDGHRQHARRRRPSPAQPPLLRLAAPPARGRAASPPRGVGRLGQLVAGRRHRGPQRADVGPGGIERDGGPLGGEVHRRASPPRARRERALDLADAGGAVHAAHGQRDARVGASAVAPKRENTSSSSSTFCWRSDLTPSAARRSRTTRCGGRAGASGPARAPPARPRSAAGCPRSRRRRRSSAGGPAPGPRCGAADPRLGLGLVVQHRDTPGGSIDGPGPPVKPCGVPAHSNSEG